MGKKGSQLSQLKASLSSVGLSRSNSTNGKSGNGHKRKKVSLGDQDRFEKEKKLEHIRKRLNQFEERVTAPKHAVGGKPLKGTTGRPGLSKQAGLEERKKTLLPQLKQRQSAHTTTFSDHRFGESNPTLTPDEKMLERFMVVKQREQQGLSGRAKSRAKFNLNDDDDGEEMKLTHFGQSLSFDNEGDDTNDDFEMAGFGEDESDDDGRIGRKQVQRDHFGGFDDAPEEAEERKKTKNEVMAEVIAKSKDHKYQRQLIREQDDDIRKGLDSEYDDLMSLLRTEVAVQPDEERVPDEEDATRANKVPLGVRGGPTSAPITPIAAASAEEGEVDYDSLVRSLAYESRSKPTDRTKTEDEIAEEDRAALLAAEKKRLRRMRGEESDSDDGDEGRKGKKKRKIVDRGADDLGDDFEGMDDDDGLGVGLGVEDGMSDDEDEDEEDEEEEDDEEGDEDDDEDEESVFDLDSDKGEEDGLEAEEQEDLISSAAKSSTSMKSSKKSSSPSKKPKKKELPFTFPCPASHEEFLEIIDEVDPDQIEIVVKRIRTIWNPRVGEGNRERMQIFLTVLIDYVLSVLSPPAPNFSILTSLLPHITSLTSSYPLLSAQHIISKLILMQKNLIRGLSQGSADAHSKTWPGLSELGLLRIIGATWSTSDFSHPVVAPAVLLVTQYLSQARVRSVGDLGAGLFLCTLLLQFESFSKRYIPEVTSFLSTAILLLTPHSSPDNQKDLPGTFPIIDLETPSVSSSIKINTKAASSLVPQSSDLESLLSDKSKLTDQAKVNLFGIALKLVGKYAQLWVGLDAFVEIFSPLEDILKVLKVSKLSTEVQTLKSSTQASLTKMIKFSLQSRRPLRLQSHKPIPIASYVPKFEAAYSFTKHYDPDTERNAASKLKSQYKQERKGAIRELRKDAKFLAAEKNRVKDAKDAEYEAKMRTAKGLITVERAEEKMAEREKKRDKRRAGK